MTAPTPPDTPPGTAPDTPTNTLPPFGVSLRDIDAAVRAMPAHPQWYDGMCEIARLTYEQLALVHLHDRCRDCGQAFVPGNTSIVVLYSNEGMPEPQDNRCYMHPDCWDMRRENWGRPRPVPASPVTWQTDTPPGHSGTGYVPVGSEGTVTILVAGAPVVGLCLADGQVITWPDGENSVVVATFPPIT